MKNMISLLLNLFKRKRTVETPVTIAEEIKNIKVVLKPPVAKPVTVVPSVVSVVTEPVVPKKKTRRSPKKDNG